MQRDLEVPCSCPSRHSCQATTMSAAANKTCATGKHSPTEQNVSNWTLHVSYLPLGIRCSEGMVFRYKGCSLYAGIAALDQWMHRPLATPTLPQTRVSQTFGSSM
jgi:hypothetical protein